MCGCGENAPIATKTSVYWGYMRGHAKKFLKGHSARVVQKHYWDDSLWEERSLGYITTCHYWLGTKDPLGYGRLGSRQLAYRVSWERINGPVPSGLELDHLCRNPSCVRPDHLEAVTHQENLRRGKNAKINMDIAKEMRSLYTGGVTQVEIAAHFNVEKRTVWAVVNNRRWTH
jgi:hypothetical protein